MWQQPRLDLKNSRRKRKTVRELNKGTFKAIYLDDVKAFKISHVKNDFFVTHVYFTPIYIEDS